MRGKRARRALARRVFLCGGEKREGEFFVSHPSDKNKSVARMGHPQYSLRLDFGDGWPGHPREKREYGVQV